MSNTTLDDRNKKLRRILESKYNRGVPDNNISEYLNEILEESEKTIISECEFITHIKMVVRECKLLEGKAGIDYLLEMVGSKQALRKLE